VVGGDSRVAFMAMLGDLFSGFVKRRLGMGPSDKALGLDYVPESLLPLLACVLVRRGHRHAHILSRPSQIGDS
jgi:hypothetical protein